MGKKRATLNRNEAKRIARENVVEQIIEVKRFHCIGGNLPVRNYVSGVYAMWKSTSPPPMQVGDPSLSLIFSGENANAQRKSGGGLPNGSHYSFHNPGTAKKLIIIYEYQVSDSDWLILAIENCLQPESEDMDLVDGHDKDGDAEDDDLGEFGLSRNSELPIYLGDPDTVAPHGETDGAYRNLTVYGQLSVLSDISTKTNVHRFLESFPDLVHRLLSVEVINFDNMYGDRQLGFSAQNIHEVLPEAASFVSFPDGGEKKAVNISAVLALIVSFLQEFYINQSLQNVRAPATKAILRSIATEDVQAFLSSAKRLDKRDSNKPEGNSDLDLDKSVMGSMSDEKLAERLCREMDENQGKYVLELLRIIDHDTAIKLKDQAGVLYQTEAKRSWGGYFIQLARTAINEKKSSKAASISSGEVTSSKPLYPWQQKALEEIGDNNAILVVPTGKGKTRVALEQCRKVLAINPTTCALFICQDRELCRQQLEFFHADGELEWRKQELACFVGGQDVSTLSGAGEWRSVGFAPSPEGFMMAVKEFRVIFITSGCLLQNVLQHTRAKAVMKEAMNRVSIVVFDEAHHANEGNHPFALLAKRFSELKHVQFLALTASPVSGSSNTAVLQEDLRQLKENLGNAKTITSVETVEEEEFFPTSKAPTILDTQVDTKPTNEEEIVVDACEYLFEELLHLSRTMGPTKEIPPGELGASKVKWAEEECAVASAANRMDAAGTFYTLSKVMECLLLVRDVGALAARDLLSTLISVHIMFAQDKNASDAVDIMARKLLNPIVPLISSEAFRCTKLEQLCLLLARKQGSSQQKTLKTLVRVATRNGAHWVADQLNRRNLRARAIVGGGFLAERKKQETMRDFKEDKFEILVGTSLVEEGLDIARCSQVICYSVAGIINTGKNLIQNAGRARMPGSHIYVFCSSISDRSNYLKTKDQIIALYNVI